jgi:hypothetical protein
MSEIMTVDTANQFYARRRIAISECHSVDDYKVIVAQDHAIAAYFEPPIYATLRQAASDQRMTMQAMVWAGLAMWLVAHGYPIDPDDMELPAKRLRGSLSQPAGSHRTGKPAEAMHQRHNGGA